MLSFPIRAARPLALALSAVALVACSDDPTTPHPAAPRLAVGDVYTVTNNKGGSEVGSLRWVLDLATGGEIIRFDPSLAGDTIVLDTTLTLRTNVTIEGPAGEGITISGGGKWGVMRIMDTPAPITMRNVSLTNGSEKYAAAMIGGSGRVIFENGSITNMRATGFAAVVIAELTLINSTVSGNVSEADGIILYAARTLTLVNSTVVNNTGWGLNAGVTMTLQNSVIAQNAGPNCQNAGGMSLVVEGRNISDDNTCGPAGPSMTITDPMLDTLADNGGPGFTHALLAGSPAIDAGTSCAVAVDQRGVDRDASCDLGAYERVVPVNVTLAIDATTAINRNGFAVVTGTVQCSGAESFQVAVSLQQSQRSGKSATLVSGSGSTPVTCDATARPWAVAIAPASGSFGMGTGVVAAATQNTAPRVIPASTSGAVQLYFARR